MLREKVFELLHHVTRKRLRHVEADDLGTYVLKFRGAGQGRKTLVAEVVCGELARRLGFRVPRLVGVEVDPVLGLGEPEQQVQELLRGSGGSNLGMDFLSGALGFDPLAFSVSPEEAGRIVRDYFWAPDMCGIDWPAILDQYRPLLERVATPDEFGDLLREVLGELGTSHAYVAPARRSEGPPASSGAVSPASATRSRKRSRAPAIISSA